MIIKFIKYIHICDFIFSKEAHFESKQTKKQMYHLDFEIFYEIIL